MRQFSELRYFFWFYFLVPDATPRNFSAKFKASHQDTIILTWRPVEKSHQNGEITSYSVSCGSSVVSVEANPELEENDGEYSQELSGLKPDANYTCQALARTRSGDGPPTTAEALTGSSHFRMKWFTIMHENYLNKTIFLNIREP